MKKSIGFLIVVFILLSFGLAIAEPTGLLMRAITSAMAPAASAYTRDRAITAMKL